MSKARRVKKQEKKWTDKMATVKRDPTGIFYLDILPYLSIGGPPVRCGPIAELKYPFGEPF
jgi:hypothetical protein